MKFKLFWSRIAISVAALTLLAVEMSEPGETLNAASLGLLALAVLPWLSSLLESAKLPGGWELKFREVEQEQKRQRREIETLKFLIEGYVTDYELVHLRKLASGEPFPFNHSESFRKELERLLAMGLIGRHEGKGLRSLFQTGDDVQNHLAVTDRGRAYLTHRSAAADL